MSNYKTTVNKNWRKRRLEPTGQNQVLKRGTLSEDIYLEKKKRYCRDVNTSEKLLNSSSFAGIAGKRFSKHTSNKLERWRPSSSSEPTDKTNVHKRPNYYKRHVEDNINNYEHRRTIDSNAAEVTPSNYEKVTSEYMEEHDRPDYTVESDGKNSQLSCRKTYNEECKNSARLNALFNGCCIKYLKTSECGQIPCTLFHKIGDLMIGGKYNDSDCGSDEDGIQLSLKVLQEFLSEAPSPPLSLIEKACTTFASFKATDAIISISKIFTSRYAQSDSEYMRSVFVKLMNPLRQIFGSQDTAVTAILNYLCKECIPKNSEQEILDKVMKTIEETVQIDDKLRVFSTLISVENYVFPQVLLEDLFNEMMHQAQKWIRKNYGILKMLTLLLLRDSQEEHLFHIWKKSPHFIEKLTYYLKSKNPMLIRILRRKLAWFESIVNTGGRYMPRVQLSTQLTRKMADTRGTMLLMNKHSGANTMSTERRNISNSDNRSSGVKEMTSVNIPNLGNNSVERAKESTAVSRVCQRQPVDMIFQQQSSPVFKQQHLKRSSGGNDSSNTAKKVSKNERSSESQCQNMPPVNKTPHQIDRSDNVKSCSVNMFEKPEVYESTGGQDSQNRTSGQYQLTSTFVPWKAPIMPLSGSVVSANRDSETDLTSKSNCRTVVPGMKHSVDMYHYTSGENHSEKEVVRFNKNSIFNTKRKSIVVPVSSHSQCSVLLKHSLNSNSMLPLLPSFAYLEKDAFSVNQFLDVNSCHSVLQVLDKWQNSQYFSDLTKHVFCMLADVYKPEKSYSLCQGLLSIATKSAKVSVAVKRSLSSISLNLLFHMVTRDNWLYAYAIFKLIMKHELLYSCCEVYRDDEFSEARRILVFVEVCMENMDFEQAAFLLVHHNLLAVDRERWRLQSTTRDMSMRNDLIKDLMDRMINNDLTLMYKFLIDLMTAQRDITKPINLVKSYELLLRKLLDQMDELMALHLFKEVYSYQEVPVVTDRILCRALVIMCADKNEMELARKLVKRGSFIGAYHRNNSTFSVMINSYFSRAEMRIFIEEALNAIGKKLKSHGEVDSDLHFTIVDGERQKESDLPKLLLGISCSIADARLRLISVLQTELNPCLYVNNQDINSRYVVVQKSVLTDYFSHRLQNERS